MATAKKKTPPKSEAKAPPKAPSGQGLKIAALKQAGSELLTAMDMVAQGRWDTSRLDEAKGRLAEAIAEA